MPQIGARRELRNPRLEGLRMWPIRGFENYLVFYRPIEEGIEVTRVLHGARDIRVILADDDPSGYSMSRSRRDSARITRNFARSGSGSVSANDSVKPLAWMSF